MIRTVSLFVCIFSLVQHQNVVQAKKIRKLNLRHQEQQRFQDQQQEDHVERNLVLQQQEHRELQNQCDAGDLITGFSLYNSTSKTMSDLQINEYFLWDFPKASIFLEQYAGGKINIAVDTITCPDKAATLCVKVSLGDFQTSYERTAPYTLYGDNVNTGVVNVVKPKQTGWQPLQAWTYSTTDCTGDATSYKRVDVHIVPKTVVTVGVGPIVAIYQGTTASSATYAQTLATVKAACDYINEGLNYGFLYKSNCWLTKLRCWRVVNTTTSPGAPPLSITYKMSATFQMGLDINPYINRDLPTRPEVTDHVQRLFTDSAPIGPFADELMSSFVKGKLDATNPYSSYTSITIG